MAWLLLQSTLMGRWTAILCQPVPWLAVAACSCRSDVSREHDPNSSGNAIDDAAVAAAELLPAAGKPGQEASPDARAAIASDGRVASTQDTTVGMRSQCQSIANKARAAVAAAAASVPQCSSDADCRPYESESDLAPCWDICGSPQWGSSAQEAAVLDALSSDEVSSACKLFLELECQVVGSGCPVFIPGDRCREEVCVSLGE